MDRSILDQCPWKTIPGLEWLIELKSNESCGASVGPFHSKPSFKSLNTVCWLTTAWFLVEGEPQKWLL